MTDSSSSAPKAKSSPFPWIIGGCGCLLFGIGIIVAGVFFFVMKVTEEPEKVVKEFLAASAAGDSDRAWATFAPELQQVQPLDEFHDVLSSHPQLFDGSDPSWTNRGVKDGVASFIGTVKVKEGGEVPCSFTLRQYDDGWKILSWHIGGES